MTLQTKAGSMIQYATKSGKMKRPDICEVCGCNVVEMNELRNQYGIAEKVLILAHHWKGYEYPLDVWWICSRCNALLRIHDGSLSLEDARETIGKFDLEQEKWFYGLFYNTPTP